MAVGSCYLIRHVAAPCSGTQGEVWCVHKCRKHANGETNYTLFSKKRYICFWLCLSLWL